MARGLEDPGPRALNSRPGGWNVWVDITPEETTVNDIDKQTAIVVGVGHGAHGGHLSAGTVEYVAMQAGALDLGVQVVHVVPLHTAANSRMRDVGPTFDSLVERGQRSLDQAVRMLRDRLGSRAPVSGELLRGGVVQSLADRSRFAQLLVLQRSEASRWERLTNGSTIAAVASVAHAPVVAVPADWSPQAGPRPITVPVDDATRSRAEIWTALGMAAAHDVPVQVLRATYIPSVYEQLLLRDTAHHDLLVSARAELERDVDLSRELRDRVPVTFEVVFGRTVEEIIRAGDRSSLVVLARRDPRFALGSHLGPVVRHVLREATCPVMVVEPTLGELVPELARDLATTRAATTVALTAG
jgi:nucleotide-binding universal stress UspA family protein